MNFMAISTAPTDGSRILLVSDGDDEPFIGYFYKGAFIKESNENLAFAYAWAELPALPERALFPRIPSDEE